MNIKKEIIYRTNFDFADNDDGIAVNDYLYLLSITFDINTLLE